MRPTERETDPDLDEDHPLFIKTGREPTLVHAGAQIGPFTLLAPLGDGGMGKVWLAKHQGLRRRVALKVLHRKIHEVRRQPTALRTGSAGARAPATPWHRLAGGFR